MAAASGQAAYRPLLKIKLGGDGDGERIAAVRQAAPRSELIVDANEAWTSGNLEQNLAACAKAGVTLVEQPLPAGQDEALARIARPLAVCADESVHDRASLDGLRAPFAGAAPRWGTALGRQPGQSPGGRAVGLRGQSMSREPHHDGA